MRRHGTTGERPLARFEQDEGGVLRPLAEGPYRRFGARCAPVSVSPRVAETVKVQRRSLQVYAEAVR